MRTKSEGTGRASWTSCCQPSASLSVSATSGDFLSAHIKTAAVGVYCTLVAIWHGEFFRPPVYGSYGRTYKMLVMFFLSFFLSFFRHAFSEFPRPIALKLCHMVGICVYFIMQVQKLGGHSPQKKLGAKNMQNFGQFWTTSDFDREYLRNG